MENMCNYYKIYQKLPELCMHVSHQLNQAKGTEKFVAENTIFPFGTQILLKNGFWMASLHTQMKRSCFQPSMP